MLGRYIKINSLAHFANALTPVFNDRLSAASSLLGPGYSSTLRISTYSSSVPGVIIRITNLRVSSVTSHQFTGAQIMGFHPWRPKEESPNVIGPANAMVKLLMGFATLEEVRSFVPDFSVLPEAVPLVEVLFPLVRGPTHHYG